MSMTRCDHCPAKADGDCPAAALNNPRLCGLVHPSHPDAAAREGYAAMLRGDPKPAPAATPVIIPPPAPVEPPSLLTKIATATTAAVTFVASGFETLDADATSARLAICSTCDQRTPGGLCSGCGCILSAKARLPHERCPEGKWATPQGLSPGSTAATGSTP